LHIRHLDGEEREFIIFRVIMNRLINQWTFERQSMKKLIRFLSQECGDDRLDIINGCGLCIKVLYFTLTELNQDKK